MLLSVSEFLMQFFKMSNHFTRKHMTEFSNAKKRNDLGFINFDLNADLEYLFNWNVKQLFLYLTAEYETEDNVIITCF